MFNTALNVLKKLENKGYEAYIVGGFVRDQYMNKESIDIDICTNATPKEIKSIFTKGMLPSIQYGSVTVIYKNIRFEITTYRKEIKYQNNRLPVKIKYINNLLEDLKRRDFTINTLCMDSRGNIIDYLNGRIDIDNKIIKMVGNPKYKLKEDSLRILRAIRFATILNFNIDDNLLKYIKKYGYLLRKLSYQRKKEELDKIFTSSNVRYGIELIRKLELDKHLELSNINLLVITNSMIGIWAQLNVINIYKFNNNEKMIITKINELMRKDILNFENLYKYGLYISTLAGEIKGMERKIIANEYNNLPIKSKKDILITPKEICKILNKKPGPFLNELLNNIEINILQKKIINNKESLIKYIIETHNK